MSSCAVLFGLLGSHNIGIAMATPQGLVVPNVKGCERRSITEVSDPWAVGEEHIVACGFQEASWKRLPLPRALL